MPLELAEELWGQLGFPHTARRRRRVHRADVEALQADPELVALGILEPDSQAALVRTWGRSFARLAEWQVSLLAGIALADDDPRRGSTSWSRRCCPRVERAPGLHLAPPPRERRAATAAHGRVRARRDADGRRCSPTSSATPARARASTETELVDLVEVFEDETTRAVVAAGGRVIKTIGDEVLFVADDAARGDRGRPACSPGAARTPTTTSPGCAPGIAYGAVTSRLGDVFGPTVNIASRLTSVARPGTRAGRPRRLRRPHRPGPARPTPPPTAPRSPSCIDRAADELADLSPVRRARGPAVPPAAAGVGEGLPPPRALGGTPAPWQSRSP